MASSRQSKSGGHAVGCEVGHPAGDDFGTAPDGSETGAESTGDLSESTRDLPESTRDWVQDSELEAELKSRRSEIYIRAVKLLARREHSYFELEAKLEKAGFEYDLIAVVLERLVDKGFLSDARFAEAYVEQRFNKGYGERDIIANLARRGIDRQLASRALADFVSATNIDWHEHAASVLMRRFKLATDDLARVCSADAAIEGAVEHPTTHTEPLAETTQERRSRAREQAVEAQRTRKRWGNFLLRRGFSNDQIISAINSAMEAV